MKWINAIAVLLSVIMLGCSSGSPGETATTAKEKEGEVISYHDNGNVSSTISYRNGRKHGLAKSFYPTGEIMRSIYYVEGVKHGLAQTFHKNGKPMMETDYVDGKKEGVRKRFYQKGAVSSTQEFKNDFAGKGLKEFSTRGKSLDKFPELIVNEADLTKSTGKYIIEVYFENVLGKEAYYIGDLLDGKFLHAGLEPIQLQGQKAYIEIQVAPGTQLSNEFNIVGVQKTKKGNYYITEKLVEVNIRN